MESLREHPSDIPLLANFFLERFARKTNKPVKRFTPAALDKMMAYDWPGNVRELEHAVEPMLIMASGPAVEAEDLPAELQSRGPESPAGKGVRLDAIEKRHILEVLDACGQNQGEAAKRLGIGRNTLWRKLKAFGISAQSLRQKMS